MATAKKTGKVTAAQRAKVASDAAQAAAAARGQKPGTRKDGATKVFWTDAERARLARVVAELLHSAQFKKPREALAAAQLDPRAELPAHRRRPVTHFSQEQVWLAPLLVSELNRLQAEQQHAKVARASAEKQALDKAFAEEADTPPAATAQPEPTPPPTPVADPARIGHAFLSLRAMLVDELAAVFVEAALKAMGSGLLGVQPQVELAPAGLNGVNSEGQRQRIVFQREPSGPRKTALLVVGLKGAQKTEIERDFANRFDLRFVGADESKDQLRAMAERAETTVVMTDFISHSHEDIVKARSPHYIRQAGGMTNLKATLAGLTN